MSPSRLHLKRVDTGVWNRAESANRVRIHFGSAPAGARFQFALYSDQHRDLAPGRQAVRVTLEGHSDRRGLG